MQKIPLPTKLEVQKSKENPKQASITIEPCFPGYGTTIGNTLRRVLLSSLPGAAVAAIKIKGVHHEFSSVPGISEDVVDIILNLKQLRIKITDEEMIVLNLKFKGEGKITAKEIEVPAGVEIANPDLQIATSNNKKDALEMKIWVMPGRGYVPAEEHNLNLEVDAITIDSIFTPVLKVGFKVENVRVGKRTDFDKLILDIQTDGTITPEKALIESVKILIDQFSFLLEQEKNIISEVKVKTEIKKAKTAKTKVHPVKLPQSGTAKGRFNRVKKTKK